MVFMLNDGIEPNQTKQIGRLRRKKFKKGKAKKMKFDGLSDGMLVLAAVGGVIGFGLLDTLADQF